MKKFERWMSRVGFALGFVAGMSAMGAKIASADAVNMTKMGAGVFSHLEGKGLEAFFEVEVGSEIWAFKAEFATDGDEVPYYQIRVTPFSLALGEAAKLRAHLFPMEVSRSVPVGNDFSLKVALLGVSYPLNFKKGNWAFFVNLAADAIGYKLAQAVEAERETFKGFHLVTAEIVAGVMRPLNDLFTVTVTLGTKADFSLGDSDGFAVQSDVSTYIRAAGSLGGLLQVWVQLAEVLRADSNYSVDSATLLTSGVTFYF